LLPPKAAPPPNSPPEAPVAGAPKAFDEPVVAAAPKVGVLAPELPKRPGAEPPDVPLLTAPNKGLFAPSLFCCPKPPKAAMVRGVLVRSELCGVVIERGSCLHGAEEQRLRNGHAGKLLGKASTDAKGANTNDQIGQ
jgi:hypothetical protein